MPRREWAAKPSRSEAQRDAAARLITELASTVHGKYGGLPWADLDQVGLTIVGPASAVATERAPSVASNTPTASALASDAAASAEDTRGDFGLPGSWTARWRPLDDPSVPAGALVPHDALAATATAVLRTERAWAATSGADAAMVASPGLAAAEPAAPVGTAAAATHDPVAGRESGPGQEVAPLARQPAPETARTAMDKDVAALRAWWWRGTTSTKLSYLLSRLLAPEEHAEDEGERIGQAHCLRQACLLG